MGETLVFQVRKHPILLFIVSVLFFVLALALKPNQAFADCGLFTGNPHDYAGAVIEAVWQQWGTGAYYQANDVLVMVDTVVRPGPQGGNIINRSDGFRTYNAAFYQINSGCYTWPFGDGTNVVLGYGVTSPAWAWGPYWGEWALDCDAEFFGIGNETGFHVYGLGTPAGAREGGWWDVVYIQPPNGFTQHAVTVYHEPPPSPPSTPTVQIYCDNQTPKAIIRWSGTTGSIGGFWVDVSTSSFFLGFSNKWVGAAYSTVAPDGFNPAFSFVSGSRYYTRVYNGATSGTRSFVAPSCAAPIVDLLINGSNSPPAIEQGDAITASWTTANATSCSASGQWSGNKAVPSGSENRTADSASYGLKTYVLTCTGPGGSASDTVSIAVGRKPYLRVYGGDVLAGSGFGSTCSPTASSNIIGYNISGPNWGGAGVQFASQASGAITEFTSVALRTGLANGPPKGLAFSNTAGDPIWGGGFGTAPCAVDYFGTVSGYTDPGNNVNATNVGLGQHLVYRHDGDVMISGNIVLSGADGGSWTCSPAGCNIPSFYLIVRGNIYIQGPVNQLDGVFVAQDDGSGNKGRIYTCASGFQSAAANPGAFHNACSSRLTINGAFLANRVVFGRTNGTLRSSVANETNVSGNIAEVFNFSPELWLVNPGVLPTSTTKYNSISSLPPVL